jgi:hypothetical protein
MKFVVALAGLLIFALLLLVSYVCYIKFLRVDVVFYASLNAALIAVAVFGVMLYALPFFARLSALEKAQLVMICALSGYAFAISIPTVIDRSLSFYILEKLQQRGGGIQAARFAQVFTDEYMPEHRLVDVRLTEQMESGTIRIAHGCVLLTARGERLANFSRFFRQNLLPKERLLAGEYSADLTDPFARSKPTPDYLCSDR